MSLPSRERGLKRKQIARLSELSEVAPFAGAWIEIISALTDAGMLVVAPFAGAWIEIRERDRRPARPGGRSLRGSVD